MLAFRGQAHGMEKWTLKQKMMHDMKLLEEVKHNYDLVNKLFIMCIDRGIRLVMENPFSEEHFLRRYWCLKPSIIDKDRRDNGDYFKKPTQYWFLNFKPQDNLVFEFFEHNVTDNTEDAIRWMNREMADQIGAATIKQARSMISPTYANRFIRQYLLDTR